MVACGPRPPHDALWLDDPCVVVEVLSPSTARQDLVEKRQAYREIPTVRAYLVVESAWRCLYRHWRDDEGGWQQETIAGVVGEILLPCPPGAVLSLDRIYAELDLPAEPPRPRRVRERAPELHEPGDALAALDQR